MFTPWLSSGPLEALLQIPERFMDPGKEPLLYCIYIFAVSCASAEVQLTRVNLLLIVSRSSDMPGNATARTLIAEIFERAYERLNIEVRGRTVEVPVNKFFKALNCLLLHKNVCTLTKAFLAKKDFLSINQFKFLFPRTIR